MASSNYILDKEVDEWVKKVRKAMGKATAKKVLRKGARIAVKEMKNIILQEARYEDLMKDPSKVLRTGTVIGDYPIGNLAASIGAFTFSKSPSYFVGPRSRKYKGFRGKILKADGYYGNIFNNGSKHYKGVDFIGKTVTKTEGQVKQKIKSEAMKELRIEAKKNGIA